MGSSESRFLIGTAEPASQQRFLKVNTNDYGQPVILTKRRDPQDQLQKILFKTKSKHIELRFDCFPQPRLASTNTGHVIIEPNKPLKKVSSLFSFEEKNFSFGWKFILLQQRSSKQASWTNLPKTQDLTWDQAQFHQFLVMIVDSKSRVLSHSPDQQQPFVECINLQLDNSLKGFEDMSRYLWTLDCVESNMSEKEVALLVSVPLISILLVATLMVVTMAMLHPESAASVASITIPGGGGGGLHGHSFNHHHCFGPCFFSPVPYFIFYDSSASKSENQQSVTLEKTVKEEPRLLPSEQALGALLSSSEWQFWLTTHIQTL